jgi:hypothetical protein
MAAPMAQRRRGRAASPNIGPVVEVDVPQYEAGKRMRKIRVWRELMMRRVHPMLKIVLTALAVFLISSVQSRSQDALGTFVFLFLQPVPEIDVTRNYTEYVTHSFIASTPVDSTVVIHGSCIFEETTRTSEHLAEVRAAKTAGRKRRIGKTQQPSRGMSRPVAASRGRPGLQI